MGANQTGSSVHNCPSPREFAEFFERKVATVRNSTVGGAVSSVLPHATEILESLQPCTTDDVRSVITKAPSKSCALDPLPTDVLKSFLPELLPFITALCNASLQQGCLPSSQRHAIITPRLKKPGADPADVQNYRPVSNLTFMS